MAKDNNTIIGVEVEVPGTYEVEVELLWPYIFRKKILTCFVRGGCCSVILFLAVLQDTQVPHQQPRDFVCH